LATGSKVKVFEVDNDKKDEENVVTHAVVVNVARATLYGRLIEEGNVSITITSIVPSSVDVLLYEANNNDHPPLVKLGNALKSITK